MEDRFDMENPLSPTRTARLPRVIGAGDAFSGHSLYDYLFEKAVPVVGAKGYDTDAEYLAITGILGVAPHTTRYGGDKGVMRYLRFSLEMSGRKPYTGTFDAEVSISSGAPVTLTTPKTGESWTAVAKIPEPIHVDCPIFPDVEGMLGLSINLNPNEIIHVTETEDSIVLTSARYGHGVGMSQRGAEWMAKTYGWDYRQILRFYYPGTELVKRETVPALREPISAEFLSTPGPAPTPTPRPTLMPQSVAPGDGLRVVKVTGIAANSSLNLRSEPNLNAEIVMRLFLGQELLVVEELPDGWLKVKTDVASGYVMESFVSDK